MAANRDSFYIWAQTYGFYLSWVEMLVNVLVSWARKTANVNYFRTKLDVGAGGVGAAGEIAKVSQVFQPSGRF